MTRRPDDSIVRGILRRNRRVGRLAALFACLALLASSLCAQTPQKSRIVTVDQLGINRPNDNLFKTIYKFTLSAFQIGPTPGAVLRFLILSVKAGSRSRELTRA